jgi:hypothetical protein
MYKYLVQRISQTAYVRSAVEDHASLDSLKQKPTRRMIWGLIVIGISYTIGWPMVGLLGMLAVYLNEPLVAVIGGPVTYGLSHLTFMVGAWLAGTEHAKVLCRWATRLIVSKLGDRDQTRNLA